MPKTLEWLNAKDGRLSKEASAIKLYRSGDLEVALLSSCVMKKNEKRSFCHLGSRERQATA